MWKWILAAIHAVIGFFLWIVLFNLALSLLGLGEPTPEVADEANTLALGSIAASAVFAALHGLGAFRRCARREANAGPSQEGA